MSRPKSPKPVPPLPPLPSYRLPDTFVDAIRERIAVATADAEPGETAWLVHADAWLGAVILDGAAVEPDELLRGSWHIRTNDEQLTPVVAAGIRAALGGRATQDDDWPEPGQVAVASPWCKSGRWYPHALSIGCPTVVVTTGGKANPPEAPALADRHVELSGPPYAGTLADTIAAATGLARGVVAVTEAECDGMGWTDVQLVLHPGCDHSDALDRVRRLGKVRRGQWQDAQDEVVDILGLKGAKRGVTLVPADPAAKAAPAGDVVRRLADMPGFGEQARTWGLALAADLQEYRAGRLPWRDVDRGILLSGPPGSGKTTYAKALALECECELVPTTYMDWSAAGSGSNDTMSKGMATLFAKWRKLAEKAPIILFVDEIDTIGARGANGHNESWFASVINAWLAFLDGAVPRDGIVVVAATNYPERVDPALMRAGRLDRHVVLDAPSPDALAGILRTHLGPGADLSDLAEAARACRGMSPAEIGRVVRDARRLARTVFKRAVSADDVRLVLATLRRQSGVKPETERTIAVHEAGHALVMLRSPHVDLWHVDIDAAQAMSSRPGIDTPAVIEGRLDILVGGMVAEEVLLGCHSAGCEADLLEATALATRAHALWGMGARGLRTLTVDEAIRDAGVAGAADAMLRAAHRRVTALVTEHREAVERLADALVERRYLDGAEVRDVVGSSPAPACA